LSEGWAAFPPGVVAAYEALIAKDRRRIFGSAAGGGKTNTTEKEQQHMGQQATTKAERRNLRHEIGDKAAAAVAELREMVGQLTLQHRAIATELLDYKRQVEMSAASRTGDLKRLHQHAEMLEGVGGKLGQLREDLDALAAVALRINNGEPGTVGAALLAKVVDLKAQLELGAEAVTVRTTFYERLRWLFLGIVPKRVPRLDVMSVNADPGGNRVIRRDAGGALQAVS
jgi:hypothetical protein